MADDSDEDRPKRIVENQPYDETLEVSGAEDVASIYTPTPRHPRNHQQHQPQASSSHHNNQQLQLYQSHLQPGGGASNRLLQPQSHSRSTPPPTSSSSNNSANVRPRISRPNEERPQGEYQPQIRHPHQQQQQQQQQQPIRAGPDHRMSTESPDIDDDALKASDRKMYSNPQGGRAGEMGAEGGRAASDGGRDSASEANESDEDDTQYNNYNDQQGGYDPAVYRDLPVSPEIKDIFKFIERYQPQQIELDFKLRPFIPDYIPSIGDIDAFLKVPRPDNKDDMLGLTVVDEPSSNQSDPHVLDLFFRTLSKQAGAAAESGGQPTAVKSVESANTKAIDSWIRNISALQKNKPIQTVNYQKPMPSMDNLMSEWPPEFEELLKEVSLPSSELDVDLNTYADILCALLDVPVYKSRIQSVHVLLNLYTEFKNSEHFRSNNGLNGTFKGGYGGGAGGRGDRADRLVID